MQVCLALRYLATGANFSVVGDYQGVHKSTVSLCVKDFTNYMYQRRQNYIHFPATEQERYATAQGFYDNYGEKPLCIGCIDGTHVPILTPKVNEKAYVNRKNYHSINAMVYKQKNCIRVCFSYALYVVLCHVTLRLCDC